MSNTQMLDGVSFLNLLRYGADNLNKNRSTVNDLNVFPVPDGDTGDNMFMTIDCGVSGVGTKDISSLGDISSDIAHHMLLGARGNSGVILSRMFYGVSKGFEGKKCADTDILGKALQNGVEEAYSSVSVPVEGTMLTVLRDAVEFANSNIKSEDSLEKYFRLFLSELKESLERTPELLAILKESGVVDSGGAGLVFIAEGILDAIEGNVSGNALSYIDASSKNKSVDISLFTEDSELLYGYCTEFLLRLQSSKVDIDSFDESVISDYLNENGDSVVFFRDKSVIKVHVHTMFPGNILNECQKYGEFLTLKIENMTLQHSENENNKSVNLRTKVRKKYATVAVAAGDGIKDTFLSIGTDTVIDGGQCMNPSTEDFIKAFDELNSDVIFVFPNNGNVLLTAELAKEMYEGSDIRIIPTKNIGEGYSALSLYDDSSENTDEIEKELVSAYEGVVCGMVSVATRDSVKDGVTISKNGYISFTDDKVLFSGSDRLVCAEKLCENVDAGKYDVLIVICGSDTNEEEAEYLYSSLSSKYKRTEVIMIDGKQPVYDYIMVFQ